jgi:hypothetical protein
VTYFSLKFVIFLHCRYDVLLADSDRFHVVERDVETVQKIASERSTCWCLHQGNKGIEYFYHVLVISPLLYEWV